jgi:cytochrome c biogenesis protein CcmG, thiol:disulfide interchange protein DsbE
MSSEPGAGGMPDGRSGRQLVGMLLRASAVAVVFALLGLLIWDIVQSGNGASFATKIKQGKKPTAPAFVFPVLWDHRETLPAALRSRLADGRLALTELRGYPVVVNFWASWCVPCRKEAPTFHAVAARYAGRVVVVGMDTQDFKSAARKFLRRYDVNYVSVRDGTDRTYTAYGLTGVPETYFLDRRGRALRHAVGAVSRRELEDAVRTLLKESR